MLLRAFLFFLIVLPSLVRAEDMPLQAYLDHALASSEDIHAANLDIESLKLEIEARDLELTASIGVELNRFWDDRPSNSSNVTQEGQTADLVILKTLPTGTTLSIDSGLEVSSLRSNPDDEFNIVNWQGGITQSLWQNSFGAQTRLRRQRDRYEMQSRFLTLLQERQTFLIEFENFYWNLAFAQEEVTIRRENLERSKRILAWIEDRVNRFVAQRSDLLQAQALLTNRQLQLQLAEDNLKTLRSQLFERLELPAEFNVATDELKKERTLDTLLIPSELAGKAPVLIDSLQEVAEADYLDYEYKLQSDRLKPILDVGYSYGKRGLNSSLRRAGTQAFDGGNEYHQVGVLFSVPLDFHLKNKSRRSFQLKAEAQKIRSQRAKRQSKLKWEDLERTIVEQRQRVTTATELAKYNKEKSEEERRLYEQGRSTAFQAISFEQEAAESELLVIELMAQLKRSEALARGYLFNPKGL